MQSPFRVCSQQLPPQSMQGGQKQPSSADSFWRPDNMRDHMKKLHEAVEISKYLLKELEEIQSRKRGLNFPKDGSTKMAIGVSEGIHERRIQCEAQESVSLEAANSLCTYLKVLVEPLAAVVGHEGSWEERCAAVRFVQNLQKYKRNKRWRKRKKKRIVELLLKERDNYDKADLEADEWRTREIAKDIATRKVESMKEIAKMKAKEERKRLESELELVLMVEKLQELRSIRVQKLKKQGHFFPEEDDIFLERVRAAFEEEQRRAVVCASTNAAKDAIATAEEFRKLKDPLGKDAEVSSETVPADTEERNFIGNESGSHLDESSGGDEKVEGKEIGPYDSLSNLPAEFYHYYHGSNYDLGTLIEVRRMWDEYIRPAGGSRIPGHWVSAPPPADDVWASYLVHPK